MTTERWRSMSRIVDAALDLSPIERAAYVDRECAQDERLKHDVHEFLAACEAVSTSPAFLGAHPLRFASELAEDVEQRAADAHAGLRERIQKALGDRYEIGGVLGSGGAATVFRGVDRMTKAVVALKVLHPELSLGITSERFLREVQIAASLRHPNIVPLLTAGMAGDLPYYVMPCIEGETLRARLNRDAQLPVSVVLAIAKDVAAALEAAHSRGILHRDIKPQNILLDGDRALVADFGIARALETAGGDELTESGTVLGTPAYMSPEQVSGDAPIDARSDVYSLGCVVYEMLAGEPPFSGKQARAVLAKQLWAPVPDVRILRGALPENAHAVLSTALCKTASDRFAAASEFVRALEEALQSAAGASRRPLITRRRAIVAASVAMCVLGAWTVSESWPATEAAALARADSTRIVVLPMESRGAGVSSLPPEAAQAAVARWSDVTIVSAQDVRDEAGSGTTPLSSRSARALALRFRAARYLRTTIEPAGAKVRVSAELFDVHDRDTPLSRASRDVGGAADSLHRALSFVTDAVLLRASDSVMVADGVSRTRSLSARQSLLRGITFLDRWQLAAAESAFDGAAHSDPAYAQAPLWLALTRLWAGKDSAAWVVPAEGAAARRAALPPAEQYLADAVVKLARGDRVGACAVWSDAAGRHAFDFYAWYGAAQCLEKDDVVLPDPRSPTRWRFRTSLHAAMTHYRRAFTLRPAVLSSLRDDQFRRLRRILFTSGRDVRMGRRAGERAPTFAAYPSLDGDTLVFHPVPLAQFANAAPPVVLRSLSAALQQQRLLLVEIATEWSQNRAGDPLAHELVGLALTLVGDRSSLDTLEYAYRLAHDDATRLRIGLTRVLAAVQLAVPDDTVAVRRARVLADSLVTRGRLTGDNALAFAGVAALTGRAGLADSLEANAPYSRTRPEQVMPARLERRLSMLAALGGPPHRETMLHELTARAVGAFPARQQDSVENLIYRRAASLGLVTGTLRGALDRADSAYVLIEAGKAIARGDSLSARRALAGMERVRIGMSSNVSPDVLVVQAVLLERLGDRRGALQLMDAELNAIRTSVPAPDAVIAAATMRALIVRADLAHATGDSATADKLGRAIAELWTNADDFLQPTVARMRSYRINAIRR